MQGCHHLVKRHLCWQPRGQLPHSYRVELHDLQIHPGEQGQAGPGRAGPGQMGGQRSPLHLSVLLPSWLVSQGRSRYRPSSHSGLKMEIKCKVQNETQSKITYVLESSAVFRHELWRKSSHVCKSSYWKQIPSLPPHSHVSKTHKIV